jgi:hypothetical protein
VNRVAEKFDPFVRTKGPVQSFRPSPLERYAALRVVPQNQAPW